MLNVSDIPSGESYSYIMKDVGDHQKSSINIEYELTQNVKIIRDILVTTVWGSNNMPMAAVVVSQEGVKLKTWHYEIYPSSKLFPGSNVFPRGSRNKYPPFYPVDYIPPIYPPFSLPSYPATSTGKNLYSYFPGIAQPQDKVAVKTTDKVFVRLSIDNPHTANAETRLYVEKIGSKGKEVYSGPLNWRFKNINKIGVGCTYSNATPYDLSFGSINVNGDIPSADWYSIRDYDGFRVESSDANALWVGAEEIDDSATHSELTKLKNLARYDYAKVATGSSITGSPIGIRWSI